MYLLHCSFYELSNDGKVNFILEQATKVHKGSRSIVLLFLYLGARWGWVVNATPRPFYTRYPLYRRLGGPQGRSGRMRKISSPRGFDPRTDQPVVIPVRLQWWSHFQIIHWQLLNCAIYVQLHRVEANFDNTSHEMKERWNRQSCCFEKMFRRRSRNNLKAPRSCKRKR
jgi:hypothetical protein